ESRLAFNCETSSSNPSSIDYILSIIKQERQELMLIIATLDFQTTKSICRINLWGSLQQRAMRHFSFM
ncbi:5542_t:CDS:1, partial [Cetraspora pellucida]